MKKFLAGLIALAAFALPGFSQAAPPTRLGDPVATIKGQPIYEQDLAPELGSKLLQLRNQEYQIKSKALDDLIRKRVIEAEAKKRGVSADKLLEQEVDSKVAEPSEGEIQGYYLAIKNQTNQPFEEIKPKIQQALKLLKIQQARQTYADSLRAKNEIVVLLSPPKVEVAADPSRIRGNPNAPVTIVEFSDFQCPFCKKADATMKNLLAKYNGQVKLSYRDFPMRSLHSHAELAAEAGRCAQEQGKFWEYHDALFADQSKLDEAGLEVTAQKLGLDEKTFQSCLTSGKYKAAIDQDVEAGTKAGVIGTPGFFINGEFVDGAQSDTDFIRVIDRELAATNSKPATQASR